MKVGIVFDNTLRPETTGFYCRRALSRLVDVEHLHPEELTRIPTGLFDLFVLVDDGLDYPLPESLRPRAAWAIDTHMNLNRCIRRFGDAEWLFAAQKKGAHEMRAALGKSVHWLPLACDPELHFPLTNLDRIYDVGFIGNAIGNKRLDHLSTISQRFSNHWIGQAYRADMCTMYGQMKVAFNCSVNADINMRIFEALACGVPFITDAITANGFHELFDVGEHLLCYDSGSELIRGIELLLSDDALREMLAEKGYRHVISNHTYDQRMRTLMDTVLGQSSRLPKNERVVEKPLQYFEFDRPDVASLIPLHCRKILDVGCGAGALGRALKMRQECDVTGIEQSPIAARLARERLDCVIESSVDDLGEASFEHAAFDCIIFADVLEHLRTPESTLKQCSKWLKEGGVVVVSIPNSRNHSVLRALVDGNWTYEKAGLLDEDHVRCFTNREIDKLLYRTGYETEQRLAIPGPGHQEWQQHGSPSQLRFDRVQIDCSTVEEAEEFFVYQYIIQARKRKRADYGLTSIIIVTHNQIAFTRQCIESILARTDELIELVFVDNASTDGTPEYLASLPNSTLIRNSQNCGFAPAVNQGIAVARGNQLLLLNNDTIVTTGWLDGLLEALHDRSDTGMVGPVSNNVSGLQQIPVSYNELTCLDGFAWEQRRFRNLAEVDRLVGFCLLIRRDVVDRIGVLDERFEIGCFEDDDLCLRAISAGFRLLIVSSVFVHHFGSVTFQACGIDFEELMRQNRGRFDDKWSTTSSSVLAQVEAPTESQILASVPKSLSFRSLYNVSVLDDGSELYRRNSIRLSLSMIVRDNEDTIEACLESIYPWVDEMIIVDTGSSDRTPEICKRYGAKLFEFPWCEDFAAARNSSLSHCSGEWVFWLDSDDVIEEKEGQKLRELALGKHPPTTYGYIVQVHCPSGTPGELTVVDHVKLIRNIPALRFEHRIHEQILPAIRRAGGDVSFTDIFVTHSGSRQSAQTRQRKLERDFRILELDLLEHPDHPFVLFNLGMTHEDAGNYEQAERYLRQCIEVSTECESHLRKAWALLVNCARSLNRTEEAILLSTEALNKFSDDKELLFRRAMLFQDVGDLESSISDYENVLTTPVDRVLASVDPTICGHKARHNLAVVLEQHGEFAEAKSQWERVTVDCPEFQPAWIELIRVAISNNQLESAKQILHRMPGSHLESIKAIATARVQEAFGEIAAAKLSLETAWKQGKEPECLDELARILFQAGEYKEASKVIYELHSYRPDDPVILHNLGSALLADGNAEEAVAWLRKSALLRPGNSATVQFLADALRRCGKNDEAQTVVSQS